MADRKTRGNPNYTIEIVKYNVRDGSGSPRESITATLPEEIALNVQSEYEARYANFLNERLPFATNFQALAGAGVFYQALTSQLWISSDPLEISLTLLFDAVDDAGREVTSQVSKLQSWVMPTISESDGILYSPGPTPLNPEDGRVVVSIGRFMTLNSAIIPSVNATYKVMPDENGQFISATADVTFRTFLTPNQKEFLAYFRNLGTDVAGPSGAANLEYYFTNILNDFGLGGG